MDDGKKIVAVIPCYNEASRLNLDSFTRVVKGRPWLHLIFVNDGSQDETAGVIVKIEAKIKKQVSIISHDTNRGKAEAVRTGFNRAFRMRPWAVGYFDADLSAPLEEIDKLAEVMRERRAIMVMGSRIHMLGYDIDRNPFRHYLGRLFATAASLSLNLPVYDTQCGAKLLLFSDDTKKVFATPFQSRWIFDVEILARLARVLPAGAARHRIIEQPLRAWNGKTGSKLRTLDFFRAGLELAKIAWFEQPHQKK